MDTSLEGKVCVVTGGAGGIGSAVAKAYLKAGATGVTLVDRDISPTSPALEPLLTPYHDRILLVSGDVTQPATHAEYVRQTLDKWGRLDISAQVAGICPPPASILDTRVEDWDAMMAVNARGVFLGLQSSAKAMLAQPKSRDCAIVLISSQFGLEGLPGFSGYSASKFAVRGLMQVAAQEFAPEGIRVNAVCPGPINTNMLHSANTPEQVEQIVKGVPLARCGEPEEIAAAVLFLSSKAGGFCSGTAMKVDGGMARFA